jgi:hypothetical protein
LIVQKLLLSDGNKAIAGGCEYGGQFDALTFKTVCFQRPLAVKAKTDFGALNSQRM